MYLSEPPIQTMGLTFLKTGQLGRKIVVGIIFHMRYLYST